MKPHVNRAIPALPGALPGLGHLHLFASDPLRFFTRLREQGDLVRWRLGPHHNAFISNPADITATLLDVEKTFTTGSSLDNGYALNLFAGNGIVVSHGDFWRGQRKMMQPGMRPQRIAGYADTMVELTSRMLDEWRPGQLRDVRTDMLALTQKIVAKTLFGADVTGDAAAVGRALDVAAHQIGAEFRSVTAFLPPWLVTPGRRRLKVAIAEIEAVLYRIIAERRVADPADRPDDMLSLLMDARDDDGHPMSHTQLRDETMSLYIAGHETTGYTLVWTCLMLSRHPEVRERMTAEIVEAIGDRPPTMADYRSLPYTEAIVKETLRIFPAAWLLPVRAAVDVTIAGHRVPAGTDVWMSQWATHRDPRWFTDPERFQPERFLGEAAGQIPKFAWFPFGGGPHVCLGSRFALVEAVLILASIAQRFHPHIDPALNLPPRPLLTLQPGRNVPARLIPTPTHAHRTA